jgi:tagatose 6-phosphate kinase
LAVDVTVDVDSLTPGEVHRAQRARRSAGGKGVNVARAAANLGERALLIGLVGGGRGEEIRSLLDEENVESSLIETTGESRACTILLEPSGTATVINERGAKLERDESIATSSALVESVRDEIHDARAVALMGSLQPGLPESLYRELVTMCRNAGKFCLVDSSGAALRQTLSAGPAVVKPNRVEAEALLARRLDNDRACADAAIELRRSGAELAVLTLGSDGVVFSRRESAARCLSSPPVDLRYGNPTGAGDSLAAGLLVGHLRGLSDEDKVRYGVAAATASLAEGYGRFRARDLRLDAVRIEALD